uniref:Uncharacterized protein n=1 Tax=Erpetoichthys calabaricus TaxID=27687 RepID=A0A8C4X7N8_ERPCA
MSANYTGPIVTAKSFPTLDTWSTVSAVCLTYKDD